MRKKWMRLGGGILAAVLAFSMVPARMAGAEDSVLTGAEDSVLSGAEDSSLAGTEDSNPSGTEENGEAPAANGEENGAVFLSEGDGTSDTADTDDGMITIRIAHTNDIHGYYKYDAENYKTQIGFSALKALIDQEEADLVLDIGDTFHGQAFATIEQGQGIAELMKEVGYDAMTPGNHDWSYGADRLKELEDMGGFEILASNVVEEDGSAYFDTPYLVEDVTDEDGTTVRVGIVGVIDDAFYSSTASSNVAGLQFQEESRVAAETAGKLKAEQDCDIVIAITHQSDCAGFVSGLSNVDAVIAGHEHRLINKTCPDSTGARVPVVEAGYYFTNVGFLSLTWDAGTETVTSAEETVYSVAETAALSNDVVDAKTAEIESRQAGVLGTVIGTSSQEYPFDWEDIRLEEQPIGRIVTASYLDWTGADVAVENAGGIRAGIPQGDVTYKDLISISPYANLLLVKELTGQQILDMVEYTLEVRRLCAEVYAKQLEAVENGEDPMQYSWPSDSGAILQFGGIKVEYDMTKPQGQRVVSALTGGEALEKDRIYEVAMNSYIAEDSRYTGVAEAPVYKEYGTCEEALRRYIGKGTFEQAAAEANLTSVKETEPLPTPGGNQGTGTTETGVENVSSTKKTDTVDTGDSQIVVIWAALLLCSGLATVVVAGRRKTR